MPNAVTFDAIDADVVAHGFALGITPAEIALCRREAFDDATRRLVECLVREQILKLDDDPGAPNGGAHESDGGPLGRSESRLRVLLPRSNHILSFFGETLSLGRISIRSDISIATDAGTALLSPALASAMLIDEFAGDDGDWEGLRCDFLDSAARSFLLRVLRRARRPAVALSWRGASGFDADDQVVALEQWAINGHFLHPCPKARVGLTVADEVAHAPEAGASYQLRFVALGSARLVQFDAQSRINTGQWIREAYAAERGTEAICSKTPAEIIPVHPLQIERTGLAALGSAENGVSLGTSAGPVARPLISYRTVFIPEIRLYLKLPLRARMTSAVRTLSIKPRQNSIAVTRLLDRAAASGILPSNFAFLREVSSLGAIEGDPLVKDLGYIVREACASHVSTGDRIVPACCLFESSPDQPGRMILDEILWAYAGDRPSTHALERFLADYARLYLTPCLRLIARAGIGLEAHLENCLTVFRDGVPIKALYRDNDAVSICVERLNDWYGDALAWFHPASWNVANDPFDAQEKLQHSLIHAHLGELIKAMTISYRCPEAILWDVVRSAMAAEFTTIEQCPETSRAGQQDRAFFFRPSVELKSLTKMRLANTKNRYIYTQTPNPLNVPEGNL